MYYLSRDDLEIIAKGLMSYKQDMRRENAEGTDLQEYNMLEMEDVDELAEGLGLDPDYFQPENPSE